MTIAFKLPGLYVEIGPGRLFHAFCSTIAVHLEDGLWGTRFPVLQQRLYDGRMVAEDVPMLIRELDAIRAGLRKIPPDKVVWRNGDGTTPEWATKFGPHVTDLSVYFVNTGQRNLIEVIRECAEYLAERGGEMTIVSYRESPAELQG